MDNEGSPIRYPVSRRLIAQYDFVSCPPDFLEFVAGGDGVRRVFTPNRAFFFEVALRTAIDICVSEAIGNIKRFQDHRNGIARGADHGADRGYNANKQGP